jgi:hypothetical protein
MDVLASGCTSPCQNTIAAFETWFALQREMLVPKISYVPTQDLHYVCCNGIHNKNMSKKQPKNDL